MRTTLAIDDDLLRQLKEEAARQGKTLGAVVNDLLRQGLAVRSQKPAFRLELEGWSAEPQPGVDILDRDKLFDLLNGR
jgi:plasmid stability protein